MTSTEANLQFGKNLTALRKKAELTRKQLAEILNITEMAVGSYERGIRTPSLEKILQLAEIFQVSTDDLLKNKTAENLSDGFIQCVFSVGNHRAEFNIPADREQHFLNSVKITTELIKVINQASQKTVEEKKPVDLSFTLTPSQIQFNG